MAHPNAAKLAANIPDCIKGCFDTGVAATGCDDGDYDCWCYDDPHQTIVDTQEVCLINKKNKLGIECSDEDKFDMEQNYWKICEQYWEPYGTAIQPETARKTSPPKTNLPSSATSTNQPSTTSIAVSTSITEKSSITSVAISTTFSTQTSITSIVGSETSTNPSIAPTNSATGAGVVEDSTDSEDTAEGLSPSAKAGTAVGATCAVLLLGAIVLLYLRRRRRRTKLEDEATVFPKHKASMYAEMPGVNDPRPIELGADCPFAELDGTSAHPPREKEKDLPETPTIPNSKLYSPRYREG